MTATAVILMVWATLQAPTVLFFPSMPVCEEELARLQAEKRYTYYGLCHQEVSAIYQSPRLKRMPVRP